MTAPVFAASELAQRFGLDLRGPDHDVAGVGTLADATPGQLGFLANPRYRGQLADTRAGVVVLREDDASAFAGTSLVARDPYAAFARISAFVDFGNVYNGWDNFSANDLRISTGIALLWRSPMGPLSISYAIPLRKQDSDQVERLQFSFGGQL